MFKQENFYANGFTTQKLYFFFISEKLELVNEVSYNFSYERRIEEFLGKFDYQGDGNGGKRIKKKDY